ncbi:MAG TPA: SRPBCC family protein [Pyrinomonadaceae bacterium]|jgi:ribosome-associated toxin RatA of RatAB toxin-antitoxin module
MSEYEQSITISRAPERVFSQVTAVEQLPKYFSMVSRAERQSGERVRVEGEIFGYRFNQTGFFRVDEKSRRVDFGPEFYTAFRGWAQVTPGPDISAADLTVHLSFDISQQQEERLRGQITNLDAVIRDSLKRALESFKNYCEGHGDPLDEADAAAPA